MRLAGRLGAVLVALGSPGSALLVDAASFAVAALLAWLHLPARADLVEPESFLADMRECWGEVRPQPSVWAIRAPAPEGEPAAA